MPFKNFKKKPVSPQSTTMKKQTYNFKFNPFPKSFEHGDQLDADAQMSRGNIGFFPGLSTNESVLAFTEDINKPLKSLNEYMAHCRKHGGDNHIEVGMRHGYVWLNGLGHTDKAIAENFSGNIGELNRLITKKLTTFAKNGLPRKKKEKKGSL